MNDSRRTSNRESYRNDWDFDYDFDYDEKEYGFDHRKQECDCERCFSKHPQTKKVLLECGFDPQDAIFKIDDDEVEDDQKFTLARLIIDTSCLCRPQVKIEFSSLITYEVEDEGSEAEVEVELIFKLIRISNGNKEVIQTWTYEKEFEVDNSGSHELEVEISEPFTVTYCDRHCPDCYEYKMVVEGKDFEGEFEFLNVVKPNLSAIAQGLCK